MCVIIMTLFMFMTSLQAQNSSSADKAALQIIHASADPALAAVDVYLNGEIILRDFRFQQATPFLELTTDRRNSIEITRTGDRPENGISFKLNLQAGGQYYAVAKGLLSPESFRPNPAGLSTAFELALIPARLPSEIDEDISIIRFINTSTDAPEFALEFSDFKINSSGVSFGSSSDQLLIPSTARHFDLLNVMPAFGNSSTGTRPVISAEFDFRRLAGESALIISSGFFNSRGNASFGNALTAEQKNFQLLFIFENGTVVPVSAKTEQSAAPAFTAEDFRFGNYPNPFNPTTTISYTLPETADVRLEVFNLQGQRVALLVNGTQTAGTYNVRFDALRLSSGIYLSRLQAGSFSQVQRMTLIK